ncbi:GTP-binding protein EngB required for normal cell division [Agrococcus baldri]|uniref:GTP-binding protein EngB required for normal cell division n=1 Tax=Agrococcus baldri TaxID=153730 RepID=A0AA94HN48_9MICO|nr:GTPase [Agrococcus baldri]SFS13805.1 GTP-binding protein EngB required for normal cell division [Agrococcus baldri]
MSEPSVDQLLGALSEAAELGAGRVPTDELEQVRRIAERAGERRALSSEHTVVGFFGATGSGKSSLMNALAGEPIARTHVGRPTTSVPLAAVWNPRGASALLDWLQVGDRRVMEVPFAAGQDLSLILLDLPDFDSVALDHRAIAERLAGQVDVLVWVVDPQKYADAVIHRDFIAPLATHASVTAAVLNQVDRLPPGEVEQVVDSLRGLLRRDGLERVQVLPVSATEGTGVDALRALIARFAAERKAASQRLSADVRSIAGRLEAAGVPGKMRGADVQQLERGLSRAANVDAVAQAVADSYRKRAGQVTGWPLTAWLLRLAPDPLRRLHLALGRDRGRDAEVHRTGMPPMNAAQRAQAGLAVRAYADAAAAGLGDGWAAAIHEHAADALEALPSELDRAVARTDLGARGSWWWPLLAAIQWLALLVAVIGGVWLLLPIVLPLWGMVAPAIPQFEGTETWLDGWPIPLVGLLGGVLVGILLGLIGAAIGGAVGAARRARARRRLRKQVGAVALESVVLPIEGERERARQFAVALARASGRKR